MDIILKLIDENADLSYTGLQEMKMNKLYHAARNHFGNWANVLNEAGIVYDKVKRPSRLPVWTKEKIVAEIENLKEIHLPGEFDDKETYFREIESGIEAKMFDPVPYDYLASGIRSIIAMIGDLMLRLFDQQKSVISPSELSGIVIIDEIDVHLHPIYQKKIVEK